MPGPAELRPDSTAGQALTMLLVALRELNKPASKQEVLNFIQTQGWFDIHPEDRLPYPSVGSDEPRWKTLLAWARENSAEQGFIERQPRDCWQGTKDGLNAAVLIKRKYASGELNVQSCYLWTPAFKKFLNPTYEPSAADVKRPKHIYEDHLPFGKRSVRGNREFEKLLSRWFNMQK